MSFNSGSSNPRRREYQSLDPPVSEDEWSSTELKKTPGMPRMKSRDAMKDSSLDDLLSSGDESDSHDGANVKLLPLDKNAQRKKKGKQVQFTPDTSSASPDAIDGPGEPRDVSKAIENMLSREREILSETFDEDLDHASKYVFDDEDSDEYGIPTHKNQGGTGYGDGRRRSWASGIKSLLHITAWWHVFPLIAVGLLVMWLATKGLPWVLGGKKQKEYVRFSICHTLHIWHRANLNVFCNSLNLNPLLTCDASHLFRGIRLLSAGQTVHGKKAIARHTILSNGWSLWRRSTLQLGRDGEWASVLATLGPR